MEKIAKIMSKDHKIIEKHIQDFSKKSTRENFIKFSDELERHLLTEENAIFSLSGKNSETKKYSIDKILTDHQTLRKMLFDIKQSKQNNRAIKIENLKNLLHAHASFEETLFYPELDEGLKGWIKQNIINKIKTMMD